MLFQVIWCKLGSTFRINNYSSHRVFHLQSVRLIQLSGVVWVLTLLYKEEQSHMEHWCQRSQVWTHWVGIGMDSSTRHHSEREKIVSNSQHNLCTSLISTQIDWSWMQQQKVSNQWTSPICRSSTSLRSCMHLTISIYPTTNNRPHFQDRTWLNRN